MKDQIEMVSLENLVSSKHVYRKFEKVLDFSIFDKTLGKIEKKAGFNGYGAKRMFKCILLQHLEDLSDRELESFLEDNVSGKWFCGFSLMDKTPDHSSFGKFRDRLGVEKLAEMFQVFREQLKAKGLKNEFFSVVDATHLVSKASLWEERDKAVKQRYEKLNNEVLPKVAVDKEARIGCKGKSKFWYGYKIARSIDMQSGLVNRTHIEGANVHDIRMMEKVLPEGGAIYADKGFCSKKLEERLEKRNCTPRAVKRNNMKNKNRDFDRYITKWRGPFERMFSRMRKRARYIGKVKNYFAEMMDCISFNLRRLIVLSAGVMEAS
ncbi:MAG: transposase [Candidatus Caenarcaniphilales bacterium]|nr:transposase [Candidatus Caenarcaniphilales bacterium]